MSYKLSPDTNLFSYTFLPRLTLGPFCWVGLGYDPTPTERTQRQFLHHLLNCSATRLVNSWAINWPHCIICALSPSSLWRVRVLVTRVDMTLGDLRGCLEKNSVRLISLTPIDVWMSQSFFPRVSLHTFFWFLFILWWYVGWGFRFGVLEWVFGVGGIQLMGFGACGMWLSCFFWGDLGSLYKHRRTNLGKNLAYEGHIVILIVHVHPISKGC